MSERKSITYSPAFKVEAVRRYLEGGRSYRQICEELGIKDKKTLRQWVAKVKNSESLEDGRGKSASPRKGRPRTKFETIEEKLAYVEAERDYLKKLFRSRFGHEWGAHKKSTSSK
jgi:transposase-like protein